tara:strand:- start:103 stop:351 length:249 start_codon:yes stop_codon:yes gene_type:complete
MSSVFTQLGEKVKEKLDEKVDASGGNVSGTLAVDGHLRLPEYTTSTLPSAGVARRIVYVTDEDCLAFDTGTNWKKVNFDSNL